jgi:hypothetical protein
MITVVAISLLICRSGAECICNVGKPGNQGRLMLERIRSGERAPEHQGLGRHKTEENGEQRRRK